MPPNIVYVPICYIPGWEWYMGFLDPILFIPYTMTYISIFFAFYKEEKSYIGYITIYQYILWLFSYIVQISFQSPRPYPECSTRLMTEFGLPDSGLVILTSTAVAIIFFWVMYRRKRETFDTYRRELLDDKKSTKINKLLNLALSFYYMLIVLFFLFIFPFLFYFFYISSLLQVIVSMVIGIGGTFIFCLALLILEKSPTKKSHPYLKL